MTRKISAEKMRKRQFLEKNLALKCHFLQVSLVKMLFYLLSCGAYLTFSLNKIYSFCIETAKTTSMG